MGLTEWFKGKPKYTILSEENKQELMDLQRKFYMEEAKKIIEEKSKELAREEFGIKKKKETY